MAGAAERDGGRVGAAGLVELQLAVAAVVGAGTGDDGAVAEVDAGAAAVAATAPRSQGFGGETMIEDEGEGTSRWTESSALPGIPPSGSWESIRLSPKGGSLPPAAASTDRLPSDRT